MPYTTGHRLGSHVVYNSRDMKRLVAICAAVALMVAAGCGKKDEKSEAKPRAPQPPPVNQEESKKIPVPVPPLPGPTVPKVQARP